MNPEDKDYDVIIVQVESDDLQKLNEKLCNNVEHDDLQFKEYHPHVTVAYVKKGLGKQFDGKDIITGEELDLKVLMFSPKEGEKRELELHKKASSNLLEISKIGINGKMYPLLASEATLDSYLAVISEIQNMYTLKKTKSLAADIEVLDEKRRHIHDILVDEVFINLNNNFPDLNISENDLEKIRFIISNVIEELYNFRQKKEASLLSYYMNQIDDLIFEPVSENVWDTIEVEGLNDEHDAHDPSQWVMAELVLDPSDIKGLKSFNEDIINKFNQFDISLKEKYHLKLVDLINYEEGKIVIVKSNVIKESSFMPSNTDLAPSDDWAGTVGYPTNESMDAPQNVSDEETWNSPENDRPRSKNFLKRMLSLFQNPLSKKEEPKDVVPVKEAAEQPLGDLTQFALDDKQIRQHFKNRGTTVEDVISSLPNFSIKYTPKELEKQNPSLKDTTKGFYDYRSGTLYKSKFL